MKYLTRNEATAYLRANGLNCGDGLLSNLAIAGQGPQFRYWGRRPIYTEEDVSLWLEARLGARIKKTSGNRARLARQAMEAAFASEPPLGPPTRKTRHKRPAPQPPPKRVSTPTRTSRRHRWRHKQPNSDFTPPPPT